MNVTAVGTRRTRGVSILSRAAAADWRRRVHNRLARGARRLGVSRASNAHSLTLAAASVRDASPCGPRVVWTDG